MSSWQLPEGIDELTGENAAKFERIRRQLIDLYSDNGYELVIPPMVENVDSMLLNSSEVNEKTFKFLDPASGKMLGVHADITPQIARIDAKRGGDTQQKYCYVNAILQTRADDFYASRSPIQAGAELYGSNDTASDLEAIDLMLQSMTVLEISPVVLSIGHVAIFNTLLEGEDISPEQASQLRQIFVKRSTPDLNVFIANNTLANAKKFIKLMELEGRAEILEEALSVFADFEPIQNAISELQSMHVHLEKTGVEVVYDLAEIKAYGYHNGVIFSAYNQNYSKALAQGGRYNGIGESFGQSRAATGFSFDLKFLSQNK